MPNASSGNCLKAGSAALLFEQFTKVFKPHMGSLLHMVAKIGPRNKKLKRKEATPVETPSKTHSSFVPLLGDEL